MSSSGPSDLAGVARDASTIAEVLATFEEEGYRGQFVARAGGNVECAQCHTQARADTMEHEPLRRLEGASDPDDMLAIAALTCPSCRALGTLVIGYGPNATAEDGDVLAWLEAAPD
jgi:hypothetical protein